VIVEGLVPDARRPGSTRVLVNGRPAWTVPADTIAALRLEVGSVLRGEAVDQLDRAAEVEGAFRAALRELAFKLERKGHSAAAIAPAVDRLQALGLLDDAEFARLYVEAKLARGRGPSRLRHDLARLGVSREIADCVLAAVAADTDDPLARPRELITRRAHQLRAIPRDARRRRLLAFLARRGYRGSEARTLVDEALEG
jgi:SOS response regulatory protein OraA/RecX